jgi:hypothetical protein
MDDQGTNQESGGSVKTLGAMAFVLVTTVSQVVIGVLLYRQRVVDGGNAIWDSDFAIFFLPMLFAIAVNTFMLGVAMPVKWNPAKRYAAACALAILVGVVSEAVYFFVAFNTYGT